MGDLFKRRASVALTAAVALIFFTAVSSSEASATKAWAPTKVSRAPAYDWPYPSIISSFRMSGATVPYARGIYTGGGSSLGAIFYEGTGRHSFRIFTSTGSLTASYPMAGGVRLGDADLPPEGYTGYLAVVDEGSHELKAYGMTGSFYRVIRTLAADVVAYARGGHVIDYLYLGTRTGVIRRYTPAWSFLNSFATGVPTADLAAGRGYNEYWGNWVILGPSRAPAAIRAYRGEAGSFYGSFALPGNASCGAIYSGRGRTTMWCLRNLGTAIWAYELDTGPLMAVEPASLGKVKALFK